MKKLPPEDRVNVKRIRRNRTQLGEAKLAELLVRQYDLLSSDERHAAATAARMCGEAYAEVHPFASIGFEHYLKCVVMDGFKKKVMNDVDYALWSFAPRDDARVLEFCRGFREALAGPKKRQKKQAATKKTLEQARDYLRNPPPAESEGHKRLTKFIDAFVERKSKKPGRRKGKKS